MENKDRLKIIGLVGIILIILASIIGVAWVNSPEQFTISLSMDNNTLDALKITQNLTINNTAAPNNYNTLVLSDCINNCIIMRTGMLVNDDCEKRCLKQELENTK